MESQQQTHYDLISIVGYSTFITKGLWEGKKNVEPCLVTDYVRILPRGNWFPYVLPKKGSSFWVLKFDVNKLELMQLDFYEGVDAGLYKRKSIKVTLKNSKSISAFIYIPTEHTIRSQGLTPDTDTTDKWKDAIKKYPEIIEQFPELIS